MLRNKLWGFALCAMVMASCKEKGPSINFTDVQADPDDTTYVLTTVPAAQPRNVLLEEFTGVTCPNCPSGHEIVSSIKAQWGSRLVAIGLYQEGLLVTAPVHENGTVLTTDDFTISWANKINNAIYSGQANVLPIGGVDRVKFGSQLLRDKSSWAADVNTRMVIPTPMNLEAVSTYTDGDSTLKVKITATFTTAVNRRVYLLAGITQDSIVDYQEDGLIKIPDYLHNHVCRGLITPNDVNGIELGSNGIYEPGRVYVKTLTVNLPKVLKDSSQYLNTSYIKPEHCNVFLFTYYKDGTSNEVLQALEQHMK